MMGDVINRKRPPLDAFVIPAILCAMAILGCAEPRDEITATLDDYASELTLFIGRDETREELTVELSIEPKNRGNVPCPVFDLRATVNGEEVSVSESGYAVDASGPSRCAYPKFTYDVPEHELLLTNFFLGESSPLWREVLGRLDIRLSDQTGQFAALFERVLPQDVEMSIIRPINGVLQIGRQVEVEFDPAPEQTQEITIVYQPESDGSATVELSEEQTRSEGSSPTNVTFTLPETDLGSGTLRVGIIPWNRLLVKCDFKACVHETLELFYQNTPMFVSRKVIVEP